jgi:hypothetical protein
MSRRHAQELRDRGGVSATSRAKRAEYWNRLLAAKADEQGQEREDVYGSLGSTPLEPTPVESANLRDASLESTTPPDLPPPPAPR